MRRIAKTSIPISLIALFLTVASGTSRAHEPMAHLSPAYSSDGASVIGVRVDRIQPTSVFARIGLHDGDVIVECNGIPIRTKADAVAFLREVRTAPSLRLVVLEPNGGTRTISVAVRPK